MRALKTLMLNAFRSSGSGGAKASLPAGGALLLSCLVVFCLILGAWFYSFRWWFMKPETVRNVVVVNATEEWHEYADNLDNDLYVFWYHVHPYIFDVSHFSKLMKNDNSQLTIVFDKDGNILTFYPPDDLTYFDKREDFKDGILDGYQDWLKVRAGIPVSSTDVVGLDLAGVESPESSSGLDPFLRTLAFMLIPLLFFICVLYSSMTKGTNIIAGAKEQNTFAAILMTPVPRHIIILGNVLGVWLSSMIPVTILSVLVTTVPLYAKGAIPSFLVMAVLAFFIAALVVLISVMSSNVISAQTAFLPIFLIFITLCITCMQDPEEYLGIYEYMPLYGQYLGIAISLTSGANIPALIVSSIVTLLLAFLAVYVSVRLLDSERFTVSVMSASDKELLRAEREQARASRNNKRLSSRASVFGFKPKGSLNGLSFSITQLLRPLILLSVFQLISLIPPLLMTDGEYLTNIMYSLREVDTVSDIFVSGANIIGVLMSTPAFLLSMGLGYILIDLWYILRVLFFERYPLSEGLGLPLDRRVFSRYATGMLVGSGLIFAVFGVLVVSGQIRITGYGIALTDLPLFLSYIFMWIFQGACEEIMFRGYMMPRVASRFGLAPAIGVSSLLFCLFHCINPGFNIIAFINLILISVLYALIAYYTDNIWILCAAHTMWNFTQGNIVGLEVSGNSGNVSLIHTELSDSASALITGGIFGPEGGLAVTGVTVVAIIVVVIVFRNLKKRI
ncbi:ABC-2 family transporter protein [Ruminococcaceae bacterium YRB3002]|nr:ABC-2 family transporter protein [Ruminococcaceae bacterium YRB3002]